MKRVTFLLIFLGMFSACAQIPYRQGITFVDPHAPEAPLGDEQIVRGRPHRLLDNSDWVWPGSWLTKLILWDRRADNHLIGEETEAALRRYLQVNGLDQVKVRLNAYQVGDEWRRFVRNKSVGPGWRYTLGFISWLQYTILPGRFFGGDHYNPYSNSINLYSDIPAIALHEGGHAKDLANRKYKGTYAAAYLIPFVALYHEAQATSDALGYLRTYESLALQKEGYKILYPAYGTYLGGSASQLVPAWNFWLYAGGVATGHVAGQLRAATLKESTQSFQVCDLVEAYCRIISAFTPAQN